jgi:hypothetical protein
MHIQRTSRIRDRANSANSLLISIQRGERIVVHFCESFYIEMFEWRIFESIVQRTFTL